MLGCFPLVLPDVERSPREIGRDRVRLVARGRGDLTLEVGLHRATGDGTIAAQKALSAIYRTGQRFGAHHLVDVLLGAETERVQRLGHNWLKTFGVGTELDRRGWLSVYRQLVAQGEVLPDVAGHGGLSLAPAAAEILRGSRSIRFRVEESARERPTARTNRKSGSSAADLDPAARSLWEALRAWRLEEARRQELPPYVIFHDSTLTEVARRRPASLAALAEIPGVGRSKLERYGGAVLAVVAGSMTGTGGGTTARTPDPTP